MNIIMYAITSIIQMLVVLFLFEEMLGLRRNLLWMIPCWVLTEMVNHLTVQYIPVWNAFAYLVMLVGICCWMCSGSIKKKLLVVIGYVITYGIFELLIVGIFMYAGTLATEQVQTLWQKYTVLILTQLLVFLVLCILRPLWKKIFVHEIDFRGWLGFMGITICCFLAEIMLSMEMLTAQKGSVTTFAVLLLLLMIDFLSFYFYKGISDKRKLEAELRLNEKQMQMYLEWAENMQQTRAQTDAFRHDIRNHLGVLDNLCREGQKDGNANAYMKEIENYLQKIGILYQPAEQVEDTGNVMLDTVMNMKTGYAAANGISLVSELNVPSDMNYDSLDMVILLGNILDNAIEACKGKTKNGDRKIKIHLEYSMHNLIIYLENSYDGHLCGQKGGLNDGVFPESTKPDKGNHGIGMKNVCSVIEKYQGALNWYGGQTIFSTDIVLYHFVE